MQAGSQGLAHEAASLIGSLARPAARLPASGRAASSGDDRAITSTLLHARFSSGIPLLYWHEEVVRDFGVVFFFRLLQTSMCRPEYADAAQMHARLKPATPASRLARVNCSIVVSPS
eukprot:COSAG01_NODE_2680_length_7260_cov_8.523397_2_plen_117_part_00